MITESTIYWITRLDDIKVLLTTSGILFGFCLLITVLAAMVMSAETDNDRAISQALLKFTKRTWIIPVLALITSVFVPTTTEMCAIKLIPAISRNERLQDISDKSLELLEAKTETWLERSLDLSDGVDSDKSID